MKSVFTKTSPWFHPYITFNTSQILLNPIPHYGSKCCTFPKSFLSHFLFVSWKHLSSLCRPNWRVFTESLLTGRRRWRWWSLDNVFDRYSMSFMGCGSRTTALNKYPAWNHFRFHSNLIHLLQYHQQQNIYSPNISLDITASMKCNSLLKTLEMHSKWDSLGETEHTDKGIIYCRRLANSAQFWGQSKPHKWEIRLFPHIPCMFTNRV